MPLSNQTKLYLDFTNGLVTEVNPLLYPEGTVKDIDNIDLQRQGPARRRLGLCLETNARYSQDSWSLADIESHAITLHNWNSVNGKGSLNFLVLQIGGWLYFHDAGADEISNAPIGKLNLSSVRASEDFNTYPISATSGKGKLFVVSRKISPIYVAYNEEFNTFTGYKLTLKVRDLEGIPEESDDTLSFGNETPDGSLYQDIVDQDVILPPAFIDLTYFNIGLGPLI